MIISWDFDGTVHGFDGRDLLESHSILRNDIKSGHEVYVLTSRAKDETWGGMTGQEVEDYVTKNFGIKTIFANKDKPFYINQYEIEKHYDDNPEEIKSIQEETNAQTELITEDTSEERIEALGLNKSEELKNLTVIVYDDGSQVEIALRISRDFGKVYYFMEWEGDAYPTSKKMCVGEGFKEIERIEHFWDYLDEADLIIFPINSHHDLQVQLRNMGKNVWGGARGSILENDRVYIKELQKRLGLPVNNYIEIKGIDKLIEYLKDEKNEDKFIKQNLTRDDFESWHHISWRLTEPKLEELSYKLGAIKNEYEFIIEDPIPNAYEWAWDGYFIDDKFPDVAMYGLEVKDAGFLCHIKPFKEFPDQIKEINEKLAPTFKKYNYRNFMGYEVRISEKDKKGYLLDIACRPGSPSGETMQEGIENYSEIIYKGAQGIFIEPKWKFKYSVQMIIDSSYSLMNGWSAIYFPEKIRKFVKIKNLYKINDTYYSVPLHQEMSQIGNVLGFGNTIDEAINHCKENAKLIEGYQLEVKSSSIDTAMKYVKETEEKLGIKF